MKQTRKQRERGEIRASVDLSALYPSDGVGDRPPGNRRAPEKRKGGSHEREARAVREAIDGWRWL